MTPNPQHSNEDDVKHDLDQLTQADMAAISEFINTDLQQLMLAFFNGMTPEGLSGGLGIKLVSLTKVLALKLRALCDEKGWCKSCIGPFVAVMVHRALFQQLSMGLSVVVGFELVAISPDSLPTKPGQTPNVPPDSNSHGRN